MTTHDRDPLDPELERLMRSRSDTTEPPDDYVPRVLDELRGRGLVRVESRRPRVLVAASWFVAGIGIGALAQYVISGNDGSAQTTVASTATSTARHVLEPQIWY